jgi:hypothetical protein
LRAWRRKIKCQEKSCERRNGNDSSQPVAPSIARGQCRTDHLMPVNLGIVSSLAAQARLDPQKMNPTTALVAEPVGRVQGG